MKNLKLVFIICLAVVSLQTLAYKNVTTNGESIDYQSADAVLKTTTADCDAPSAEIFLDVNNIRAGLLNNGSLWWDGTNLPRYEVPKVNPPGSSVSINSIFAGALWIGGIDPGGQLKLAAMTYGQDGNDFWPGPLDNDGNTFSERCRQFDRFFEVRGGVIDQFKALYQKSIDGGTGFTTTDIKNITFEQNGVVYTGDQILGWPATNSIHFNVVHPSIELPNDQAIAPFWDENGDGIYNPLDGDFPSLGECNGVGDDEFADQMVWWIYNDRGNIHTETQGEAIGIEVSAMAFAFATNDEINNMSFYKYQVRNKASTQLDSVYFAQWVDPDLGKFDDDFVGCDTTTNLGIVYNGDADDNDIAGYGTEIPILGIDFFKGPLDQDGNEIGLSAFVYYNNDFTETGNPENAAHYYGYMAGVWKNQQPITFGDDGFNAGNEPTPFMFPNDPSDSSPNAWSECAVNNVPADRRFVQVSGPFELKSGAVNEVIVGAVWVPNQTYPCPSFEPLLRVDKKAQALFDNCFELIPGPDAPEMVIRELNNELILSIYNNEFSNNFQESFDLRDPIITEEGVDNTYTFQGYKIYQFIDGSTTVADSDDPNKVKEIFQVDIKDDIALLVNYGKDEITRENFIGEIGVDGSNSGIKHSFRITTDAFTNSELVNNQKYYFGVVAYAENQFRPFDVQNPELGGQEIEYLEGSKGANRVYTGIPHDPEPQNGGMALNSEFGEGVIVETLGGTGNGGLFLDLTKETEDAILASPFSFVENPKYKALGGPITVQIYDPVLIKDNEYIVEFKNFDIGSTTVLPNSAAWDITNITTNVTFPENTDQLYEYTPEQAIPEFDQSSQGFLVGALQNTGSDPVNNIDGTTTEIIGADIVWSNDLEQWLGFVPDNDALDEQNWIRAGEEFLLEQIRNDYPYDFDENYEGVLNGAFSPYCLTAVTGQHIDPVEDNNSFFTYGPAYAFAGTTPPPNTLNDLMSIDLVFTPDKEKWTRCPVVDLSPNNSFGDDRHDRKSFYDQKGVGLNSVDKNGNPIAGRGMGWFPGYAINVETGERLNMMFGENSFSSVSDMVWNPTDQVGGLIQGSDPVWGGMHFIYVLNTRYDNANTLDAEFGIYESTGDESIKREIYERVAWVSIPVMNDGFEALSAEEGIVPNEAKVRVRVSKPYSVYDNSKTGDLRAPRYKFKFTNKQAIKGDANLSKNALDKVAVVPNPYYAYSSYETSQLDNRVKITNLPNNAEVTIMSIDGTLINKLSIDFGDDDLTIGGDDKFINTLEWNVSNSKGIRVASGMYLFHINAPGIGERTIKWFGVMRPIDLDTF